MTSLSTKRLVIALGVVLALIFFGYTFFIKDSAVPTVISQTSSEAGDNILLLVETLNKITIDKTLFESPLFLGLQDFSVELYPEQIGRPNPFASVGAESPSTNQPPRTTSQ